MTSEMMDIDNNSSTLCQEKVGSTAQPSPARHWCFTLNNHNNEDIKLISSNSSKIKRFVFQEEIGENGTPHLQGYLELKGKKKRFNYVKSILGPRAHIEVVNNINAQIAYCCKDETRSGDVYTNIESCKRIKVLDIDQLYPWENKLLEIIEAPPQDRIIHWIYDKEGNSGKSVFCKFLCVRHNAFMISNKSTDMKAGVTAAIGKGLPVKLILVDIPRSVDLKFLSYTGIEEVKNGCFFSPKYESGMCVFNTPHIFIFSNELPEIDKITNDRWRIWGIDSQFRYLLPIPLNEARERRLSSTTSVAQPTFFRTSPLANAPADRNRIYDTEFY